MEFHTASGEKENIISTNFLNFPAAAVRMLGIVLRHLSTIASVLNDFRLLSTVDAIFMHLLRCSRYCFIFLLSVAFVTLM